jgi:hypothetical protein
MDAYDPRYLYWEALDMIRKLALVGLVLLVGRGTIAQLSAASKSTSNPPVARDV